MFVDRKPPTTPPSGRARNVSQAGLFETPPANQGPRHEDAYAFVTPTWPRRLNVDVGGSPGLNALRERIAARPAVRRALAEEGLA